MGKHSFSRDFESLEVRYENAMADRYDRDYHDPPIMKRHDEDFVRFVSQHFSQGDRVLDLGCGPGSLWPYWESAFVSHGGLIGIDIAPKMISRARRLYRKGDFRVGNILEIPIDASSVDLVIASSTLHHIPDELLPKAFSEIRRVLDEHGTLVGREPVGVRRLADEPGWLSGAIMNFRHLVYRLTNTREYGEPENGPHHHAYDPRVFFEFLVQSFAAKGLEFRHPFSPYVSRSDHPMVESLALWFDDWLKNESGHMFYYSASQNYADVADVTWCIQQELERVPSYDRAMFMALLQRAAELLEREIGAARRNKS
jgi:ubiquinone/menaquinone biosynthesis C-methylase UbiE